MFGGQIEHYTSIATGFGVFVDWKMSGYHYNDYADPRVGSPITSDYHLWHHDSGHSTSWGYSTGCTWDATPRSGIFVVETAPALYHPGIGSGSLFFHTNY